MEAKTQVAQPRRTLGVMLRDPVERNVLRSLLGLSGHPQADAKLSQFIALAFQVVIRNPYLSSCDALTLLTSIKDAASLNLNLNPSLGQAYLVPYKGKAQMQIGYRGVIVMALRSGRYTHVDCACVWEWERDGFAVRMGTEPRIDHVPRPAPANVAQDIDTLVGAYAIAHLKGGGTVAHWCWADDVRAARARSQSYRSHVEKGYQSPWVEHFASMAAKTAVQRLGKKLELSAEDMRALLRDEASDQGEGAPREAEYAVVSDIADLDALLETPPVETTAVDPKLDVAGAKRVEPQDPPGGKSAKAEKPKQQEITPPAYTEDDSWGPRK